VIGIRAAGFVPFAFVDGDHFAGVASDAAVGEEVGRVGEDEVDVRTQPRIRCPAHKRSITETLTNRVRPDVASNRFQLIWRAQNVIVKFCLPEVAFSAIFVRKGGALFEGHDEGKEVGLRRVAFGEEMKMIGHETEGMEQERVARCERNQMAQCHAPKGGIGEVRAPVVRTNCDEIDSITKVIPGSKADFLTVEWHVQQGNKKRCRASRQGPSGPPHDGGKPGATTSRRKFLLAGGGGDRLRN
jgi:hypothetical protein